MYYQILLGNTSCELGYKLSGVAKWNSEKQKTETDHSTTKTAKEAGYSKEGRDSLIILERDYWGDTENRKNIILTINNLRNIRACLNFPV